MAPATVRLEGLPFRVTKDELRDFFAPIELLDVHLIMNRDGRASGLGFLQLASEDDLSSALSKSNENIGRHNRYAKVVECSSEELQWYVKRAEIANSTPLHRVKMSGLPFRVSEYEIAMWFTSTAECLDLEVHMNSEGRSSGVATAFFADREQAEKAMTKDREEMNGRYIDLHYDSSMGEVPRQGLFVRMQGLPFRASEDEMRAFFEPEAKCIGVRVIFNREGRASGDALAEFESEEQVDAAMTKDRQHLGSRFVILVREGRDDPMEMEDFNASGDKFVVRMSGLPYRAGVREIIDWFQPKAVCLNARIINNRDGRPSGEALAEFESTDEADKAMTMNRAYMGQRFVVLTPQY